MVVKSRFLKAHILAVDTVGRPSDRNNRFLIGVVASFIPQGHI